MHAVSTRSSRSRLAVSPSQLYSQSCWDPAGNSNSQQLLPASRWATTTAAQPPAPASSTAATQSPLSYDAPAPSSPLLRTGPSQLSQPTQMAEAAGGGSSSAPVSYDGLVAHLKTKKENEEHRQHTKDLAAQLDKCLQQAAQLADTITRAKDSDDATQAAVQTVAAETTALCQRLQTEWEETRAVLLKPKATPPRAPTPPPPAPAEPDPRIAMLEQALASAHAAMQAQAPCDRCTSLEHLVAELKKTVQDAVKALAEQMLARQADDVAKMAPVVAALQQATEELKAQAQTLTTATATAATTAAAPPPPPPPPTVADYWQLPPPPPMHHHHRMTQPQYHTAHKTPRTAQPAHYRHHYYHGDEAYTPPRLHTAVGSSRYTVATATTPFRRPRLTTRVPAGALPPSTRAELRQLLKHGTPHRLQGAPEALFFPNDSDSDAGFD